MSVRAGYALLVSSVLFGLLGIYSVFISAFAPFISSTPWMLALARDTYYKYLVLFLVPVTAYFVIANWVGWQYYRNS